MNCVRLCINYNVMIECLLGQYIFSKHEKWFFFQVNQKMCPYKWFGWTEMISCKFWWRKNICLLFFDDVAWPLIKSWNYSFKILHKKWTQNRNQSTKWLKVLSGKIGKLSQFHVGNAISLELNYLGSQRTNQGVCVWRSYCLHSKLHNTKSSVWAFT